ncbi:MAG TPA: DUF4376 domain-containing protein [Azoarcus taiwanensis]|nr:DUF4376 domain-containing protein [Azoarcus taiwanensis]
MAELAYKMPDGAPAPLRRLLPQVVSPEALTDAELARYGVARCVVIYPELAWWQTRGARSVDASETPHVISWAVEDRLLEEVKELAWERIKDVRAEKRAEGVAHTFPGDVVGRIQIREEDINNLLSIHAAATTALMMSQPATLPFTDAENVTHWLSAQQALEVTMAAFAHGAAVHVQSQTRRAQIEAAESVAEVVAVEWGD